MLPQLSSPPGFAECAAATGEIPGNTPCRRYGKDWGRERKILYKIDIYRKNARLQNMQQKSLLTMENSLFLERSRRFANIRRWFEFRANTLFPSAFRRIQICIYIYSFFGIPNNVLKSDFSQNGVWISTSIPSVRRPPSLPFKMCSSLPFVLPCFSSELWQETMQNYGLVLQV